MFNCRIFQTDVDSEEIKDCSDEIITAIDKDGDGQITRQKILKQEMSNQFDFLKLKCKIDYDDDSLLGLNF